VFGGGWMSRAKTRAVSYGRKFVPILSVDKLVRIRAGTQGERIVERRCQLGTHLNRCGFLGETTFLRNKRGYACRGLYTWTGTHQGAAQYQSRPSKMGIPAIGASPIRRVNNIRSNR